MILSIIIIAISLFVDGLLTLYLPYLPGNLSLFTPMTTIVSLLLIYPLYRKKEKTYFITIFIVGLIYDLLYTNLLFYDAIIFLLFGLIIKKIYKELDVNHFKVSLYIVFLIVLYEVLLAVFIRILNLVPITIPELIYKISHSLLFNMLYGELLFLIIKLLPNKFKRIDIN